MHILKLDTVQARNPTRNPTHTHISTNSPILPDPKLGIDTLFARLLVVPHGISPAAYTLSA
jgi:hypothetical protein